MLICSSPQLFAAYHVLLRRLMPRHPPYALISLILVYRWVLPHRTFRFLVSFLTSSFQVNYKTYSLSIICVFAYTLFLYSYNIICVIVYMQLSMCKARGEYKKHNQIVLLTALFTYPGGTSFPYLTPTLSSAVCRPSRDSLHIIPYLLYFVKRF